MITVFTGSPGAGKTASLVDFLSKLSDGRPLYVDGLNGFALPHEVVDASDWHNSVPDGSILVVDEVQRVWRPRAAGSKVSEAVQALETHRHRGIDVYLTTQAPALLDSNVRALVGRHVHIRDTGVLGRWWYEWPEINTSMTWRTCVNKRKFSLPKSAFSLYKSASLHIKPVRGVPRALYFAAVALFLFVAIAGYAYFTLRAKSVSPALPSSSNSQIATTTVLSSSSNFQTTQNRPIDDRVDFVPRVSFRPESAPAYDHLRVVSVMPVVVGGWCQGSTCRCITQQGTSSGLSDRECAAWVASTPFDYYAPRTTVLDRGGVHAADSQSAARSPLQSVIAGVPQTVAAVALTAPSQ